MTEPGAPEPLPELRASDAEREQAAEVLRVAASEGRLDVEELEDRLSSAYSATTRRELERLIADVSPARLGEVRAIATPGKGGGLTVKEGPGGQRWVISVMGGHDKRGRWRVAPRCTVTSVMGGSSIDLNDAELSDRLTEINVYSFMGGSEIRVPHGVNVQVSEFAFMGGNDVQIGEEIAPAGGPTIRIRLVAVMGGSSVRRGRKLSRRERRELKEAEKRERDLREADTSRPELEP
jgi:Domain of unknown function (DUF1707)/Cell wall-active antibiotics response 4TMS YvqF